MVSLNLLDSAWWNITTYQMHGGGETKHPCGTSHLATLRGSIEPIVYPVPKSLSGVREEAARETDRPCQSGCNDVFLSMFQNKTASKKTRLLQKDQTFSYHVVLIVPGCIQHPYLLTRCFFASPFTWRWLPTFCQIYFKMSGSGTKSSDAKVIKK